MGRIRDFTKIYRQNIPSVIRKNLKHDINCRKQLNADVYRDFKNRIRTNDRYKKHDGESIYILCSGPSAGLIDAEQLAGKTCISVSHFYNHKDCSVIRPKYHVLAPNHEPFGEDHYTRYISGISKWDWDYTCFFGYAPYEHSVLAYFSEHGFPPFDYSYVKTDLCHFGNRRSYLYDRPWDLSRSIPRYSTVLNLALQLAVYIGGARIYLLGCDHDYMSSIGAAITPHFYNAEEGHDDSKHLAGIETESWFRILAERWESYRMINEYCKARGVQILNATPNSKLDVFPMINFEDCV